MLWYVLVDVDGDGDNDDNIAYNNNNNMNSLFWSFCCVISCRQVQKSKLLNDISTAAAILH
jgi:hypothetical protein